MSPQYGTFIWYDVMTTDPKAATSFYRHVIGWDAQDHSMGDHGYTVFSAGAAAVAGLMAIPEELRAAGVPPCWSGYIGVDDVDGDAVRIKEAGGRVERQPADIPGVGRFAVVSDPGGAVFLIYRTNMENEPAKAGPTTPGHMAWHELHAGDLDREFAFYSGLFGWQKEEAVDLGPMGTYQTFAAGGAPCGGMMKGCAQAGPPHWKYYIAVDSVAAAAPRVTEHGGQVLRGPHEVPGGAWILEARDPQGALFAIMSAGK